MSKLQRSDSHFKSLNVLKVLMGDPIYRFKVFYEVKNLLIRYDDRTDYVNYGYWPDGYETKNPSAELVKLTVSKLDPGENDILLNAGSGMGQPDIDILSSFTVNRIIGINICQEQVEYANNRFRSVGLADRIEHHVISSGQVKEKLSDKGISGVFSVEAVTEFSEIEKFIYDCHEILPPDGKISFCDMTKVRSTSHNLFKRLLGKTFLLLTAVIYGDVWTRSEVYSELLESAGFQDIEVLNIGDKVFSYVDRQTMDNFHLLKENSINVFLRLVAFWNIRGIYLAYKWGLIDYQLFTARKSS